MRKAKVLDLKEKEIKPYPLIEIMGPIDIGKTSVAQLVARRIKATFISFPILDPYTLTGRALLASLTKTPRGLESHPQWWAHMYAANLYEQQTKLEEALLHGPVVVTNYILAYRIWMKQAGANIEGYTSTLPQPVVAYMLAGNEIVPTTRPKIDFSPEFIFKVKRNITTSTNNKIKKVILSAFESNFTYVYINNVATAITTNIKEKYGCKVNEKELYSPDSFLKKKDL